MMRRAVLFLVAAISLQAAEPIAGVWVLKSQHVTGADAPPSRALELRVSESGGRLEFEYSVAVNQKQQVSLRFAARLDGSVAEVTNLTGAKIGVARLVHAGPSAYLLTLEGPRRPSSSGRLTVSSDGKSLVSESDATEPGGVKTHTTQVFERK
jgi:hypothetical protein